MEFKEGTTIRIQIEGRRKPTTIHIDHVLESKVFTDKVIVYRYWVRKWKSWKYNVDTDDMMNYVIDLYKKHEQRKSKKKNYQPPFNDLID